MVFGRDGCPHTESTLLALIAHQVPFAYLAKGPEEDAEAYWQRYSDQFGDHLLDQKTFPTVVRCSKKSRGKFLPESLDGSETRALLEKGEFGAASASCALGQECVKNSLPTAASKEEALRLLTDSTSFFFEPTAIVKEAQVFYDPRTVRVESSLGEDEEEEW